MSIQQQDAAVIGNLRYRLVSEIAQVEKKYQEEMDLKVQELTKQSKNESETNRRKGELYLKRIEAFESDLLTVKKLYEEKEKLSKTDGPSSSKNEKVTNLKKKRVSVESNEFSEFVQETIVHLQKQVRNFRLQNVELSQVCRKQETLIRLLEKEEKQGQLLS